MENNQYIKKLPHSQVMKLDGLIPVAPNQTSSMTLVQRPNLGMTLFSLDQGEGIKMHTTKGDALVHVLSGVAEITIGDQQYTVSQGESIVMPSEIPHALRAREAFHMLLTVVKPDKE
ncbi:cupin domain-containing protein [Paenibacillus sp. HW567]|uniref:cupin domain-containing protein n=1 Tax=Paenibacillus sp. HW567 TaxID=1034769 RepID=UPI000379CD23|nr:cupin domain-containing protein [Paenibacillus sp. HW567]